MKNKAGLFSLHHPVAKWAQPKVDVKWHSYTYKQEQKTVSSKKNMLQSKVILGVTTPSP